MKTMKHKPQSFVLGLPDGFGRYVFRDQSGNYTDDIEKANRYANYRAALASRYKDTREVILRLA